MNKRSNGKRYDSPSGHSVAAGQEQRLACLASVLSTFCRVCSLFGDEAPAHDCAKIFNGTAGAMEPHALLTFAEEAYNKYHVVLGTIIADDDSTMRAQLKWSNEDWMRHNKTTVHPTVLKNNKPVKRPNTGLLPCPIPEPRFLADPSHRTKTFAGALFKLEKQKLAICKGLNKADCLKFKRDFGYMIKQLKDAPRSEWLNRANAILEH